MDIGGDKNKSNKYLCIQGYSSLTKQEVFFFIFNDFMGKLAVGAIRFIVSTIAVLGHFSLCMKTGAYVWRPLLPLGWPYVQCNCDWMNWDAAKYLSTMKGYFGLCIFWKQWKMKVQPNESYLYAVLCLSIWNVWLKLTYFTSNATFESLLFWENLDLQSLCRNANPDVAAKN